MSRVFQALEKAEREREERGKEDLSGPVFEDQKVALTDRQTSEKNKAPLRDLKKKEEHLDLSPQDKASVPTFPRDSVVAEEFRKLKTQIFLSYPNPPHSILVTSATPQEGKTLVAVNLAKAISFEMQKKALLIDGDLRKPSIFLDKFHGTKGLSDYLADQTPLSDVILSSELNGLRVIPAGSRTGKAAELIGSTKMKEMLRSLCDNENDTYIIIDSPPILSASETALLSKIVDGVILVVMAGRTPKSSIQRAVNLIGRPKIVGFVCNLKELKPSRFRGDFYHYYYYSNYHSNPK